MLAVEMSRTDPLFEWLVDGDPGAPRPDLVLARVGPWLVECGVRVSRLAAFVRTLHPQVMGRSFEWRRGVEGVKVSEAAYGILTSPTFLASPIGHVFKTGEELRRRLDPGASLDFKELERFREEGFTDYLILPLHFLDGTVHGMVCATDAEGGFTDAEVADLRRVMRPLARLAEILALRRTAANLLSSYVGHDAGERILSGQVRRGDTESIRCVVWFSDLRGFTSLSSKSQPDEIIVVLNRIFDCQVPFVEKHGGEVLKFIGDGMLAIFAIGDGDAAEVAEKAVRASTEAFGALDALNAERGRHGEPALGFGLALHVGDVAYGNIGGANRLDFTCIGAAVNLASRIEGLTGKLGKRLLLSGDLVKVLGADAKPVGTFDLKGVEGEQTVYELA